MAFKTLAVLAMLISIPLLSTCVSISGGPVHALFALTIKEAAAYSNIGISKIDRLLRTPDCPFVLYVGTKKLLKHTKFKEFLSQRLII